MSILSLGWKYPADVLGRSLDGEGGAQRQQQFDETRAVFRAPEGDVHLRADLEGRLEIGHAGTCLDIVAACRRRKGQADRQVESVGVKETAADTAPVGLEEITVVGEKRYREQRNCWSDPNRGSKEN
jgi:hypothetical protein